MPKYQNEEWLREQYIEKEKTLSEIGEECGVSGSAVGYWCEKFNISTRSLNDPKRPPHHRFNHNNYEEIKTSVDGEEKYVYIHRLIAVSKYGVDALGEDIVVHHKNGKKFDNRPENLELMTKEEHDELHRDEA